MSGRLVQSPPISRRAPSRRFALRSLTTAGIALTAFAFLGHAAVGRAPQPYTVTTDAGVRSGPGADFPVIAVIPQGETFTLTAQSHGDFYGITYKGRPGWLHASLVVGAGAPEGTPEMVGEAHAGCPEQLRSGPGAGFAALREVAPGEALNVSNTVQNGFRYVVHQGLSGWLDDRSVAWRGGATGGTLLTTSAPLNLRESPALSAPILLVMERGSAVISLDDEANGFRKVTYDGTEGWAAVAYLDESPRPH